MILTLYLSLRTYAGCFIASTLSSINLFRRKTNACPTLFIVSENMLLQASEIRIVIPAAVIGTSSTR